MNLKLSAKLRISRFPDLNAGQMNLLLCRNLSSRCWSISNPLKFAGKSGRRDDGPLIAKRGHWGSTEIVSSAAARLHFLAGPNTGGE